LGGPPVGPTPHRRFLAAPSSGVAAHALSARSDSCDDPMRGRASSAAASATPRTPPTAGGVLAHGARPPRPPISSRLLSRRAAPGRDSGRDCRCVHDALDSSPGGEILDRRDGRAGPPSETPCPYAGADDHAGPVARVAVPRRGFPRRCRAGGSKENPLKRSRARGPHRPQAIHSRARRGPHRVRRARVAISTPPSHRGPDAPTHGAGALRSSDGLSCRDDQHQGVCLFETSRCGLPGEHRPRGPPATAVVGGRPSTRGVSDWSVAKPVCEPRGG